jgi:hypothetical protein
MNIKTLFSVAVGIPFLTFFLINAEATNTTRRFRGSGSRYLQKITRFTERIESEQMPKYSRRRPRLNKYSNTNSRQRTLPSTTQKRTTRRSISRRIPFSRTKTRTVQGVKTENKNQVISADLIPFTVLVPSDFSEISDTLEWNTGSLNLSDKNNVRIHISASKKRCDGGDSFVRTCLEKASSEFVDTLRTQIPGMELVQNTDFSLNLGKIQLQKENRGRYAELQSPNYHVGHLTFFDPVKEYIWELKITDPKGQRGILNDRRILQEIFSSLIETNSTVSTPQINKRVRRLSYTLPNRRSDRGTNIRRKDPVRFDTSQTTQFQAQNIPFEIELPSYLTLVSDSINWNQGEMVFEGNETKVVITPTNEICNDQTSRLKWKCVEKNAEKFAQKLKIKFENGNVLQDMSIALQLEDVANTSQNLLQTQSSKNHIGKFFLMRKSGYRAAELTFAEPIKNGYVWNISITTPEENSSFLNDIRQKNKMFSSLFFGRK